MNKQSCAHCGHPNTVDLTSIDKVICEKCYDLSPWKLDPGQQSVLEDRKGEQLVSEESQRNENKESRIIRAARKYARYKSAEEYKAAIAARKNRAI